MSDVFTKAKRSEVMSRIRGRGNRDTELALALVLRANRIFGWRRHLMIRATVDRAWLMADRQKPRGKVHQPSTLNPQLTVRPDFVFLKLRLAVFVDGCFWHGCPKHCNQPANNRAFWQRKLSSNKSRDLIVNRTLRKSGWRVVRIWECDLADLCQRPLNSANASVFASLRRDKEFGTRNNRARLTTY